jgi:hypothetical protein
MWVGMETDNKYIYTFWMKIFVYVYNYKYEDVA